MRRAAALLGLVAHLRDAAALQLAVGEEAAAAARLWNSPAELHVAHESPPAASALISVNQVDLLWARLTSGGNNPCGGAVPCAKGRAQTLASLRSAHAHGFNVVRFGASAVSHCSLLPFCSVS